LYQATSHGSNRVGERGTMMTRNRRKKAGFTAHDIWVGVLLLESQKGEPRMGRTVRKEKREAEASCRVHCFFVHQSYHVGGPWRGPEQTREWMQDLGQITAHGNPERRRQPKNLKEYYQTRCGFVFGTLFKPLTPTDASTRSPLPGHAPQRETTMWSQASHTSQASRELRPPL